jgi:hypothetical protein
MFGEFFFFNRLFMIMIFFSFEKIISIWLESPKKKKELKGTIHLGAII